MRYFALFFMIVFLFFAYLQINDPDPVWWVTIYLVAAYVSFKAFRNEYSFELLRIITVLYLAFAINSALSMSGFEGFFTEGEGWEMKTVNQELAREAAGLGVCIFVFIIYMIRWFTLDRPVRKVGREGPPSIH